VPPDTILERARAGEYRGVLAKSIMVRAQIGFYSDREPVVSSAMEAMT
jgi:hypothetical protein